MLKERDIIAGRYRLESPIGEGAMGAVWRAQDQTLRRPVAIKLLFVRGARDPQAMVDQFLREARIAASVQHRNVIHTVDFGTVDDFQPFMVMELLSGESLGDRLARSPPLSHEQLVHIISLTLRGLSAVHDAGIVHRDLKPHNVFLQRDSDAVYPKILDFGISRSLDGGDQRPSAIATQQGLIIGTPDYMSPEQARGERDIDRRADIYSMGAILFEGLTGRLPFIADTIGDLIVQIVTTQPPRVLELAPGVPKPLSDLVAQAMARDRTQRFTDARAMRRALLAAAEASWSRGRIAASLAPPPVYASAGLLAPPAPPAPPAARVAGVSPTQDSAWGGFEGLASPRIRDDSLRDPAAVPSFSPPKRERVVAHAGDPLLDLPPAVPPQVPVGPAGRAGGARRASLDAQAEDLAPRGRAPRKPRARAQSEALEAADGLDPLYAGGDAQALDIDYERLRAAPAQPRKSRERVSTVHKAPAARRPPSRALAKTIGWLSLLCVLGLFAYLFYFPEGRASVVSLPREASGVLPDSGSADGPVVRPAARARRQSPGTAPEHLRDVVF